MNRKRILTTSIKFLLTICSLTLAVAQAQNLQAATAASYLDRGNAWFARGEYERAQADFDLAIATDPSQLYAYYNRAVTRYRLGKLDAALADFDRAIQINPRLAGAYVDRGAARQAKSDLEGALADYNQASAFTQQNKGLQQAIERRIEEAKRQIAAKR
jgi:tetratricopeptide (TPR) repeat protein